MATYTQNGLPQSPQAQPSALAPPLQSPQLERIVLAYLAQKGYTESIEVFKKEARLSDVRSAIIPGADADVAAFLLALDEDETELSWERGYEELRSWISQSLDVYKPELRSTLWPIFVHSYLALVQCNFANLAEVYYRKFHKDHEATHAQELLILSTVKSPHLMAENVWISQFLTNKFNLEMSPQGFRLLLNFLEDGGHGIVLRIVNLFINVKICETPLTTESVGVVGLTTDLISEAHKQSLQLHIPVPSDEFKEEVLHELKQDFQDSEQLVKCYHEKIKALEELARLSSAESPDAPLMPMPSSKKWNVLDAANEVRDIAKRVRMGPGAAPSVCMYTMHFTNDSLNCISFSADVTLMATGFEESYVRVWSLERDRPLSILKSDADFSRVQQMEDLNALREPVGHSCRLVGHSGPVYSAKFSNNKQFLVSCSEDCTGRLWSMDTLTNVVCYRGHLRPIWDIDISPVGFYFATASADRTAKLWTFEQIMPVRIFAGHLADVDTVRFHPNSRYVATGSSDRTARLWDAQSGRCVRAFTGHRGAVGALAISHDGRNIATSGEDGIVRLWDLGSGTLIEAMEGHTAPVHSLDFSHDNRSIVSGSADCTVRLWDARGGDDRVSGCLQSFATKQTPVYNVLFTRRNLVVAAGAFPSKYS